MTQLGMQQGSVVVCMDGAQARGANHKHAMLVVGGQEGGHMMGNDNGGVKASMLWNEWQIQCRVQGTQFTYKCRGPEENGCCTRGNGVGQRLTQQVCDPGPTRLVSGGRGHGKGGGENL